MKKNKSNVNGIIKNIEKSTKETISEEIRGECRIKYRKALLYIQNPKSPIVILVIGVGIDFLANKFIYNYKSCIEKPVLSTICICAIAAWFIICLIYQQYISILSEYEKKIEHYISVVESYENQVDKYAFIISKKFGVLSDNLFEVAMSSILKKSISDNDYIDGVQLYSYSKARCNENNKKIQFNIAYATGYVKENRPINAIIQEYYYIDYDIYNEMVNIKNMLLLVENDQKCIDDEELYKKIHKEIHDRTLRLLKKIKENFTDVEKDFDEYMNSDVADYYRLGLILGGILSCNYEDSQSIYFFDQEETDNKVLNYKRTGLLGSIYIDDLYLFSHMKPNSKKDRTYITFPFNINSQNYIFLVTINQSYENENSIESSQFLKKIEKIQEKIIGNIMDEFKLKQEQ